MYGHAVVNSPCVVKIVINAYARARMLRPRPVRGKFKSDNLQKMSSLFTADFPPYTVFPLREGEFYIAGGGGIAKTGVPNALVSCS